jgi:hypothetical protein
MALKAAAVLEGRDMLVDLCYRQAPRRGRPAAVVEAMAKLGPVGRRRVAEAERKAARKVAKRRARESTIRARVTESLTAAAVPLAAPGTGAAPDVQDGDGGSLMDALGVGRNSPFGQPAGDAPVEGAPVVPEAGLDSLGTDELRDFSKSAFGAFAQARGFGSPGWA